jgi:hypothetical protein
MCREARTLSKTEGPNTHPPHAPGPQTTPWHRILLIFGSGRQFGSQFYSALLQLSDPLWGLRMWNFTTLQVTTYEGDTLFHWDLKISKDLYFCEPQKCGFVKSIRFGSKFLTIESCHSDWLVGCKLQTIAFNLVKPCKTLFINTHRFGKWTKEYEKKKRRIKRMSI